MRWLSLSLFLLVSCVAEKGWVLNSEEGEPFISVWEVEAGYTAKLPLVEGYNYDFVVDWGDGSQAEITSADVPQRVHTYDKAGSYTVIISGLVEAWDFPMALGGNVPCKIASVPDLGDVGWKNLADAFYDCDKLSDLQGGDVSEVTNMSSMFAWANLANPDVSKWDTGNVNNMSRMFLITELANPDVSKWDTSNVNNMSDMFYLARSANPDVSEWDTSNVTDIGNMFWSAWSAAPDTSRWDFNKVTCYGALFHGANLTTATYSNTLMRIAATSDMMGNDLCVELECIEWEETLPGPYGDDPPCRTFDEITLDGGESKYNAEAAAARQELVDRGWNIRDGGQE